MNREQTINIILYTAVFWTTAYLFGAVIAAVVVVCFCLNGRRMKRKELEKKMK